MLYGIFLLIPLVQSVQYSMYDWSGLSGGAKLIGTENFVRLSQDKVFLSALSHNLLLAVVGGVVAISLSLIAAHAIQGSTRLHKSVRALYLLPHVTSLVAVSILWMFLFNPNYGLFTGIVEAVGIRPAPAWLGDKRTALPSVGLTYVWYMMGFYVMLFSAGLKGIDDEVFQAATLDGSEGFHRFRKVTWPLLWSIKRVATLNFVIGAMNTFALVFLMTNGGPDRSTEVTMTYLYEQAFQNSRMGYASSIAVVNMLVVMSLVLGLMAVMRKDPTRSRA